MSYSYGKWTKYHIMKENDTLARYLPETHILTETDFWRMLNQFGAVVIKPSEGSQGYGVVQVTKLREERFEIHSGNKKIICKRNGLTEFLDKEKYRRKIYIVQEKIPLATVGDRPFDIRVMVQRQEEKNEWSVTGKLVKVVARGYFITNVSPEIIELNAALEKSSLLEDVDFRVISDDLDIIAILTASQLNEYYPNSQIFGLDIGITDKGKLYIIEANLKPSWGLFKKLKE
ncbi:YheC/YheD family protein [Bacillaceae bacterium C204]|uniref:YheC/YheD family protein n=1 Tax=Neobacillus sp. 204 TaxID=3383351 RepID=UPI00397E13D7